MGEELREELKEKDEKTKLEEDGRKKEEEKIDFKYNTKEYLGYLLKYKGVIALIVLLVIILESSYVLDKYLFKLIVDRGGEFASNSISANILVKILLIIAVIFGTMILLRGIMKFIQIHLIVMLDANLIRDIKLKYFSHLLNLDYSFHTTNKTGSLISRLARAGGAVEDLTDLLLFNFSPLIFQGAIVAMTISYYNKISALVVVLTMISFILYSFYIQKLKEKASVISNNAEDLEKGNISDIFTNIESVKYFGKEKGVNQKYRELADNSRTAYITDWNYMRWLDTMQIIILGIGTILLLYFPFKQFLQGGLTIGDIVFIYSAYVGLMGPLFAFIWGIRGFYRSMAEFEVLFRYGKVENKIKDASDARKIEIKKGEIELKDISFKYGRRQLFENFNLKIEKNKNIALVGPSGCGKTSLIKLLYRFYDIDSGDILIDWQNIKDVKQESLREEMAIVPQECVLFDDTIYNNVKFSRPSASKEEVLKAMKFAQLDKIIERFPNKEDTIVGERGVKLSGGEKQRVSIARALLADKKILVLDEATSALDSETEQEIQEALKKLMEGRTTIIIAHRLSTIMMADEIIVMDAGKIVQRGKHEDLISQTGIYKKLWNLQKGGYIKE